MAPKSRKKAVEREATGFRPTPRLWFSRCFFGYKAYLYSSANICVVSGIFDVFHVSSQKLLVAYCWLL